MGASSQLTKFYRIAISVTAMADLKVTEGQTLQTSDTIVTEVPD